MRNGKIATLPSEIREELNLRMDRGEQGGEILAWLNGLPEVRKKLRGAFDAAPVSKQNLSQWRRGGYREWSLHHDLIHQAWQASEFAGDLEQVVDAPLLAGRMTAFVAARYAALLNSWDGAPDPQFERKLRLLRGLNQDLALMQRTLQRANLQENAYQQHIEDAHEKNTEKARQLALTPLHAALERESLKKLFALYVGGKEAGKLADLVIEVKYNLSSLKRAAPSRRSSQTRSNPVKPKPPVASSLRLEPNPHVASALRADDRAGGSTLQSQDAPSAPRAEPNPHVASALRADDRAGGSTLQSQTESNPVKPEPPIISGFSGSAVVSTASAGVPPAESSDKDRLTISDA